MFHLGITRRNVRDVGSVSEAQYNKWSVENLKPLEKRIAAVSIKFIYTAGFEWIIKICTTIFPSETRAKIRRNYGRMCLPGFHSEGPQTRRKDYISFGMWPLFEMSFRMSSKQRLHGRSLSYSKMHWSLCKRLLTCKTLLQWGRGNHF